MDILSIDCTTCGTRLKVRDANLVGQIIACPKCGSMVQVTAADGAASDAADQRIAVGPEGAVDSQAITRDSISQSELHSSEGYEAAADRAGAEGPVFQSTGLDPAPESQHQTAPQGEPSRLDAAAFAQSDRAKRTRQIGLITALSTLGLITSLVAFGSFVRWWQTAPPATAQRDEPLNEVPPVDEPRPDDTGQAGDKQASDEQASDEQGPLRSVPAVVRPAEPGNEPEAASAAGDVPDPAEPPSQDAPPLDAGSPPPTMPQGGSTATNDNSAANGENPVTTEDLAAAMIANPILPPEDTAAAAGDDTAAAATEMPAAMKRWVKVLDFNNPAEQPSLPPRRPSIKSN